MKIMFTCVCNERTYSTSAKLSHQARCKLFKEYQAKQAELIGELNVGTASGKRRKQSRAAAKPDVIQPDSASTSTSTHPPVSVSETSPATPKSKPEGPVGSVSATADSGDDLGN
jgi:hypothetical protein